MRQFFSQLGHSSLCSWARRPRARLGDRTRGATRWSRSSSCPARSRRLGSIVRRYVIAGLHACVRVCREIVVVASACVCVGISVASAFCYLCVHACFVMSLFAHLCPCMCECVRSIVFSRCLFVPPPTLLCNHIHLSAPSQIRERRKINWERWKAHHPDLGLRGVGVDLVDRSREPDRHWRSLACSWP